MIARNRNDLDAAEGVTIPPVRLPGVFGRRTGCARRGRASCVRTMPSPRVPSEQMRITGWCVLRPSRPRPFLRSSRAADEPRPPPHRPEPEKRLPRAHAPRKVVEFEDVPASPVDAQERRSIVRSRLHGHERAIREHTAAHLPRSGTKCPRRRRGRSRPNVRRARRERQSNRARAPGARRGPRGRHWPLRKTVSRNDPRRIGHNEGWSRISSHRRCLSRRSYFLHPE